MCTCGQNHASLWAVSPVNSNCCGSFASGASTSTATRCSGYATPSSYACDSGYATTATNGCFGRCSSCGGYNAYTNQTAGSFVVSRVNGCCNCPYARNCGCHRCGCAW